MTVFWTSMYCGTYPTVVALGMLTDPDVGATPPVRMFSRVVLPDPFLPISPSFSESSI